MLLVNRKINRIQKPFNMKLIFIVELTEFTASRPWLLRYLMYLLYVLFGKSLNLWNWYDLTVISNAIIWWNWTHSFQDFIASWKFRFIKKFTLSKNLLDHNPNKNNSNKKSKADCGDQTKIFAQKICAWKIFKIDCFLNCWNHSSRIKFEIRFRPVEFDCDLKD